MLRALLCVYLLTIAIGVRLAAESSSFDAFMRVHGRTYEKGSEEYHMRRMLYETRFAAAAAHNRQPGKLWSAGVNKLFDWTESEFKALRGWDGSGRPTGVGHSQTRTKSFLQQESELPAEKIWSDLNAAHHVRNQGDCGSCWAIASATVLEAHAQISGRPRTFSAQQIVECTPNPRRCGGDGGCKGATAELAMEWIMANGCAEDSAIPYNAHDGACPSSSPSLEMAQMFGQAPAGTGASAFGMTGWETLPKNEYEPLARALAERGPVAVSVAADMWMDYETGIFNSCGKDAIIDHAVTAMGYGEDSTSGVKYWLIQNSWGSDWGEVGRIRLQRHVEDDYCGMNNKPEEGVGCKGESDPVPVCGMCGVLFDSVVPHFQAA